MLSFHLAVPTGGYDPEWHLAAAILQPRSGRSTSKVSGRRRRSALDCPVSHHTRCGRLKEVNKREASANERADTPSVHEAGERSWLVLLHRGTQLLKRCRPHSADLARRTACRLCGRCLRVRPRVHLRDVGAAFKLEDECVKAHLCWLTSELTGTLRDCAARRMLPRTARGAMPQRVSVEQPVRPLAHSAHFAARVCSGPASATMPTQRARSQSAATLFS